ncbi:MAG: UDP-N-acetylglucosamine 2-epimerase (hydrolyzing), partial [Planctomycetes bacterium]|nr:UDP-N-acetylglucosamine 2-epimerase (hydrolyzing) [Planctomycetota bacterium]
DAFARLQPDIVVVLGDRFEIWAAAQAATVATIPIAHIQGGETTEGAIDEAIRHGITKMAHIHFVAAEPYRRRVIQLGEHPERVFNVGAPGLDHLTRLDLFDAPELEKAVGMHLRAPSFLVTCHPVTLRRRGSESAVSNLVNALDQFPDASILFTKTNADTDGRVINELIDEYVEGKEDRTRVFVSMGQLRYLSALRHVDVVIGNSSSAIIEAPALKTPSVNIGLRQRGRLRASSVIDCDDDKRDIVQAIDRALTPEFRDIALETKSPYGMGGAAASMVATLKQVQLGEDLLVKNFYDLG